MVAKSLVKLIDEAIIPAAALIAAKMLGILASAYFLHLPLIVTKSDFLFFLPAVHFLNLNDYISAENFANTLLLTVVCLGTTIVLIRAHFFHANHINPKFHAKLARLNLESLITPSYHLYHQALIWLVFLWMTVAFLTFNAFSKVTHYQIAIASVVIAANLTWLFAKDVEKETQDSYAA